MKISPIIMPNILWSALPKGFIRDLDSQKLDKKDPTVLLKLLDGKGLELLYFGFTIEFNLLEHIDTVPLFSNLQWTIIEKNNYNYTVIAIGNISDWLHFIEKSDDTELTEQLKLIFLRTKAKQFFM